MYGVILGTKWLSHKGLDWILNFEDDVFLQTLKGNKLHVWDHKSRGMFVAGLGIVWQTPGECATRGMWPCLIPSRTTVDLAPSYSIHLTSSFSLLFSFWTTFDNIQNLLKNKLLFFLRTFIFLLLILIDIHYLFKCYFYTWSRRC